MIKETNFAALFDLNGDNKISEEAFFSLLRINGIKPFDPRLADVNEIIRSIKPDSSGVRNLDKKVLENILHEKKLIQQTLTHQNIIPNFPEFTQSVRAIYEKVKKNKTGETASYIPQLASVDPDLFSISICTIDGQVCSMGDAKHKFSIQSTHKPINYALALEEHGEEYVHSHIGKEPSGVSFNAITLNQEKLPHNPLINAGAIMSASLVRRDLDQASRFDYMLSIWERLNGIARPTYHNSVYLSEKNTADRNFALAYFMRENNAFPENTNVREALDFYFQCCSIEGDSNMLANVAATFANSGVNPFTNDRIFHPDTVKKCLSVMYSCGMYDYSGEFSFGIGLPAKSGVSGAVWIVVPNLMGIAIYSPRLDQNGNSVRGIEVAEELVKEFNFHNYDSLKIEDSTKKDPRLHKYESKANAILSLIFAASGGDMDEIRRLHAVGVDLNESDYDGRTPLHLAAAENQVEVVKYLLENGANKTAKDRWGATPIKDAKKTKNTDLVSLLGF